MKYSYPENSRNIVSKWMKEPNGRPTRLGRYYLPAEDMFRRRDHLLTKMGYCDYKNYINSPLWKNIRHAVFVHQKVCFFCGGQGRAVHHKIYTENNLKRYNPKQHILLCLLCHELIHTNDDGNRASWHTVDFRFWVKKQEKRIQDYRVKRKVNTHRCNAMWTGTNPENRQVPGKVAALCKAG